MTTRICAKKIISICFLVTFFYAAPAFAAPDMLASNGAAKSAKKQSKGVSISLKDPRVASPSSSESPRLEFADKLLLERKIVTPYLGVKESKWSVTPVLSKMTFSSLGDNNRDFGMVWKYRF